ncbi:MAG: rod shape-determining protein [Candidatus Roizmanbacteria bacterium]|nr:MAG: rod shape-determining protein [Candidatus Roizmanbacteria bacterium]
MLNFIEIFKKIQIPFFSSLSVYFDLGTSNTRIGIKDKGIVLREPTYLGYNTRIKEYIFFGKEAKTIIGKTPNFIHIIQPLVNGILSDFDAQVALIEYFTKKSVYPYFSQTRFLKPTLKAFSVIPSIATEIEQKAVEEALEKAGCSSVYLVEKPLAVTAGCGFDIFSHQPHFIVDLGGGLIELSIVSGGGIVIQKTLKTAGEHMNKLIANYSYLKHGIILGDKTCEDLKISLLHFEGEEKTIMVRGKSLETGLPKSVRMKTADIKEALLTSFNSITDSIKELIELSPPEIADEVFKNGITLTGGIASANGLDNFFSQELKIPVVIADHYIDATLNGLIAIDKNQDQFFKLFGYK